MKQIDPQMPVDLDCLTSMYCGQNAFSIFFQNQRILKFLENKICEIDGSTDGGRLVLRRLFANLLTPVDRSQTRISIFKVTDE